MRKAFTFAASLVLAAGLAAAQSSTAPPMPFVDEGACPFEGCMYRDWRAKKTVAVYETWDRRAPLRLVYSIEPDETVTAMTGVVITTMPGRALIRQPIVGVADSKVFPYERQVLVPLKPGEIVYLLTNQGYGFQTAWFNQMIFTLDRSRFSGLFPDVPCQQDDSCTGDIIEHPVSVWWAKVRNARGQIGWTSQTADFEGAASR
jgi:hypothetical protein